jgi:hypothetical protein
MSNVKSKYTPKVGYRIDFAEVLASEYRVSATKNIYRAAPYFFLLRGVEYSFRGALHTFVHKKIS